MRGLLCGVMLFVGCLIAVPQFAEAADDAAEAQQLFDSTYGPRIKSARATPSKEDDIALAKELISTAQTLGDPGQLGLIMYHEAYDLCYLTTDGFSTAKEAMGFAIASTTDLKERGKARDRLVKVLTRQSRTGPLDDRKAASTELITLYTTSGEEHLKAKNFRESIRAYSQAAVFARMAKQDSTQVQSRLAEIRQLQRTYMQATRLEEKLLQNAKDTEAAEQLVRLHMIALDDPAAARNFVSYLDDDDLKSIVTIANTDLASIDAAQSMKLAEWYTQQSNAATGGASGRDRGRMLARAHPLFERFLKLHTTSDAQRTKATLLLAHVNNTLAKLGIQPGGSIASASPTDNTTTKTTQTKPGKPTQPATIPDVTASQVSKVPGLIGRLTVNKQDLGIAFFYQHGSTFQHNLVAETVVKAGHEMRGVRITMVGMLKVPRDMKVNFWHKGGSSSGGVIRLYVDGKEINAVGDDRTKDVGFARELKAGIYEIKWSITGGRLGSCVLLIMDGATGKPLELRTNLNLLGAQGGGQLQTLIDNSDPTKTKMPSNFPMR